MKSLISIDCKNRKLFFVDEIKFKVEKLLKQNNLILKFQKWNVCLLYTSPSPRDRQKSRMPSSA